LRGFVTDAANVAASEWRWVAQSLHASTANLGYPVGMGIAPAAASTERAAKMICEYIACQIDASAIEAATAGETGTGSTEGESAGPKDDAQEERP
jgi:hypothetical protein